MVTEMAARIVPIAGDAVAIVVIDDSVPESTSWVVAFIGFRLISPTLISPTPNSPIKNKFVSFRLLNK